ncbi:hypothetical protein B0T22DRAFT_280048 [Podospora appendiculata]|uniref:Uncharacterized protein n=1 Tax=Podospora appendiculata TaxID=314037 RepID=A0AAE0X139_9PEZI|nr:hypothetical protein B0T22DRAFT_280048 [Podospora appendiculata]
MNRFRTKKKAKDDGSTGRSSEDSDHSAMPSFKSFRRGKKAPTEEPKKELDLTSALPSNDDFRTSLLMTNLSARFSMLREQDDPNTKIGKASDDSVLFPKRQSRMPDFGFGVGGGLFDIAEVESIKASAFARTGSFVSDDTDSTKGGGVLTRAKPTDGNNLFGGRQKIYKIPAGSSKNPAAGGIGGRVLYDDDVAMSAFQRWRQSEKEKAFEEDEDAEPVRSESPPPAGYNRKRETSSTTSSASVSAMRNSTAATSITSQPTTASKDGQSGSTASASATSTPAIERSVTRTRRLYEQGLTQDMHEQQSSALSRIDTLSRQRIGTRTPDLGPNSSSPSPTVNAFADRFIGEKRTVLTKGSAPNLRSMSPPTTGSSIGTMDLGIKVPTQADSKLTFGGSPPLSPPISETGEHSMLPIQPNDVGKATAMGVFQKPTQPYDESKYAQRQLQLQQGQLQQGRETPTERIRAGSNASLVTGRSRSSSSAQRQPFEGRQEPVKMQPVVQEEPMPPSLQDGSQSSPAGFSTRTPPAVQPIIIERPSDKDHPAFRRSAMPTPLTISARNSANPSPISEDPSQSLNNSEQQSPEDSPTLPATTGLSGMVRQHLRSDSNASSVYGAAPQSTGLDSRFPIDPYESHFADSPGAKANPWTSTEHNWTLSYYGDATEPNFDASEVLPLPKGDFTSDSKAASDRSSNDMAEETDAFANQLAAARRRVRDKLTSYAESDSSRDASPLSLPEPKDLGVQAPPNPSGLGILKPKSSRGSLIDRSRNIVASTTKTKKILGLGASTMSTSPGPGKQSFDEKEYMTVDAKEVTTHDPVQEHATTPEAEKEAGSSSGNEQDEDSHTPPGLKAFRQARRELQRRRELETLARHQLSQTSQLQTQAAGAPQAVQSPPKERGTRQRTPSRERKPPPVYYRQRTPSDENGYGSNTQSPSGGQGSGDRGRSGSESRGPPVSSHNRPPRLRNNSGGQDGQLAPVAPRPPMLRAAGLPGTDIRHSPIMPPQGYPGRNGTSPLPSPHVLDRSRSTGTLAPGRPGYESHSGHPSPNLPMNGSAGLPPPSPFSMGPARSPVGTPTSFEPRTRRPSAPQSPAMGTTTNSLNDSMKRIVDKRDISEPTFVMSTSRVPTMNLPREPTSAPPLPPINPRRRREDSQSRPGYDETRMGAPRPPFASQNNNSTSSLDYSEGSRSNFSVSDDEDGGRPDPRRRLRKAIPEAHNARAPGASRDNSPSYVVKGPPASRTVMTSGPNVNHGVGSPGGMF